MTQVQKREEKGGLIFRYLNHELQDQNKLGYGTGCTTFAITAAWYFLGRSATSANGAQQIYSLEKDLRSESFDGYQVISQIGIPLYHRNPKIVFEFPEALDEYKFIGSSKYGDVLGSNAIDVMKQSFPVSYKAFNECPIRITPEETFGIGKIRGAYVDEIHTLKFFTREKVYEPRQIFREGLPLATTDKPLQSALQNTRQLLKEKLDGIYEAVQDLAGINKETFATLSTNEKKTLVTTHLPSFLAIPIGNIEGLSAPEHSNISVSPDVQRILATITEYQTLVENLSATSALEDSEVRRLVVDSIDETHDKFLDVLRQFRALQGNLLVKPGLTKTFADFLAAQVTVLKTLSIAPWFTKDESGAFFRNQAYPEAVSPLCVLASSLSNAPLMRVAASETKIGNLKHLPYALIFSRSQTTTSCVFKDGYADSPWIYFDSHGTLEGLATFTEYQTVGSLEDIKLPSRGITIQIYMRTPDCDLLEATANDFYTKNFSPEKDTKNSVKLFGAENRLAVTFQPLV